LLRFVGGVDGLELCTGVYVGVYMLFFLLFYKLIWLFIDGC